MRRTTFVRILGGSFEVPGGFGAAYRRVASDFAKPPVLRDILELVGWTATPATIARWPIFRRIEAEVYAACVHARAGDNPTPVPPRPSWFPEPWKGEPRDVSHVREDLRGAFEGPGPTELPEPPPP